MDAGGDGSATWKWICGILASLVVALAFASVGKVTREEMVTYVDSASPYAKERETLQLRDRQHDAELAELRALVASVAKGQAEMNTTVGRLTERLDAYLNRREGK